MASQVGLVFLVNLVSLDSVGLESQVGQVLVVLASQDSVAGQGSLDLVDSLDTQVFLVGQVILVNLASLDLVDLVFLASLDLVARVSQGGQASQDTLVKME